MCIIKFKRRDNVFVTLFLRFSYFFIMKVITTDLLDQLSQKAKQSPRVRTNYNYHTDFSDPINRMLNCFELGTYIRPHKHEDPDKREVFILLRGKLAVLEFADSGDIISTTILSHESGVLGIEVPAKVWHSIICLAEGTAVYELKDGPYEPLNDKNFASWAPAESDESCAEFLAALTKKAGLVS